MWCVSVCGEVVGVVCERVWGEVVGVVCERVGGEEVVGAFKLTGVKHL